MRFMRFMTKFENIRWVWLDLDDTLIDFRANSRESLRILYRDENLGRFFPSAEKWTELYEDHNARLWQAYARAEVTRDFLRMDRFRAVIAPFWSGTGEELRLFSSHLDVTYLDILARQRRLIDGALELLGWLRAQGYNIGVLSNGFAEVQHRKIASAGLGGSIDLVVLSDDIGVNKPDSRLYRHAMERTGLTDPGRHVMIGDNLSTDIAGAIGAGWGAIYFNPAAPAAACRDGYAEISSLAQARLLL